MNLLSSLLLVWFLLQQNTLIKITYRRKHIFGLYVLIIVHWWGITGQKLKAGTWKLELKQSHSGRLPGSWLSRLNFTYFLFWPFEHVSNHNYSLLHCKLIQSQALGTEGHISLPGHYWTKNIVSPQGKQQIDSSQRCQGPLLFLLICYHSWLIQ